MDRQHHWNAVYGTKGERDVSWFEASPAVSIEMIEARGPDTLRHACSTWAAVIHAWSMSSSRAA